MRLLKKVFIFSTMALLLVVAVLFSYLIYLKPQYEGHLNLKGLHSEVTVHFDEFAIPHIYGENEEDVYLALGYVHAQERLFQMELMRRIGSGRLAEILGPEMVEVDKFFRTIGIPEISRKSSKTYLSADSLPYQKAALAYLKGLNLYLEIGKTPIEFTLLGIPKAPYTPDDIYYIGGYMAFSFTEMFKTDPVLSFIKARYGKEYLAVLNNHHQQAGHSENLNEPEGKFELSITNLEKLLDKIPIKPWIGSNAWVIASKKSLNGKPILANDTHISYSQPSVWYEAHLEYPGQSFYGNFLAGFPFALTGHNQTAGWGLTMLENDDIDLYKEQVNPNNNNFYYYKGTYEELSLQSDTIKVKDGEDEIISIRSTIHGPIISDVVKDLNKNFTEPLSLWWTFTKNESQTLESFYLLSKAKKMTDAKNASAIIAAPGLNILYADVTGDIAKYTAARFVKRPDHVDPKFILDGASGKDDPIGYYAFAENPISENPEHGYIHSSNNQPENVAGFIYPGYYAPPDRAIRIENHLKNKNNVNISDMTKLMLDDVSVYHSEIAQYLGSYIKLKNHNFNDTEKEAIALLLKWDGGHGIEANGPVLYYNLLSNILKSALKDELGKEFFESFVTTHTMKQSYKNFVKSENNPWWDDVNTKRKETKEDVIVNSFKEVVYNLNEEFGNISTWQWKNFHLLEHVHPIGRKKPFNRFFNVGPFGVPGGIETINNSNFSLGNTKIFKVNYGPAMRRIIDFSDYRNSISINPTGQSGYFMSSHYDDQAEMYNNGAFRKQMMRKEEIINNKIGTLVLGPH